MFENLDVLRLAGGLARHAGARQSQLAQNVANADTPGYRARDLVPFAEAFERGEPRTDLRTTRPEHFGNAESLLDWDSIDSPDSESPNGNTVSLEDQMLKGAETVQSHQLALTVYSQALSILRTAIGGRG
jgi:flagellar basal-body rod protein FlgB